MPEIYLFFYCSNIDKCFEKKFEAGIPPGVKKRTVHEKRLIGRALVATPVRKRDRDF
ncbi:hypothetical protein J2741_002148 [Methanolinea mesophila]|nr:hypothetical protein [Methanolinea mesophila]